MRKHQDFSTRLFYPLQDYSNLIKTSNFIITSLVYVLYPLVLAVQVYRVGFSALIGLVLYPAIGFFVVTVVRKIINSPRPYEAWAIVPILKKETKGQSFPSRHVFSASIIGTVFCSQSWLLGGFILILALLLAVIRVIGGVHYPRDVIAGFLLGILLGLPIFFW